MMLTFKQLFRTMSRATGEQLSALREFNKSQSEKGRPQSVKALAEKLGLAVDRERLPRGERGFLEADTFSPSGYRIVVNQTLPIEMQRWTVMHEVGHFLRHADASNIFQREHLLDGAQAFYLDNTKEREAQDFADVVFFGDGALAAAAAALDYDLARLSRYFGLTQKTIATAMRKFGVRKF